MSGLWPAAEGAQADYERLREAVLATGRLPDDLASARFRRRGVAGLIAWPAAEPVFVAEIVGAARPAWSPYADPRVEALAVTYRLIVLGEGGEPAQHHQRTLTASGGRP